jgi:hypothetical protein
MVYASIQFNMGAYVQFMSSVNNGFISAINEHQHYAGMQTQQKRI